MFLIVPNIRFSRYIFANLREMRELHPPIFHRKRTVLHTDSGTFSDSFYGEFREEDGVSAIRREDLHFFFSPAVQLRTTVMGAEATCSGAVMIRKRCPSADTSYE